MNRQRSLAEISDAINKRNLGGHDGNITHEVRNLQVTVPHTGAFGEFQRGQWTCPELDMDIEVAVKYPRSDGKNEEEIQYFHKIFVREFGLWQGIKAHPNVLPLVGYILNGSGFGIVSPYSQDGNLGSWLESLDEPLADHRRYELIKDIADGLAHLHNNAIVHGDLHDGNIIMWDGRAVIMDFALSRRILRSSLSQFSVTSITNVLSEFLPLGQLPVTSLLRGRFKTYDVVPELRNHPERDITLESDVYLFGALATNLLPRTKTVRALQRSGYGLLLKLLEECKSEDPMARPEATEVASRMAEMQLVGEPIQSPE